MQISRSKYRSLVSFEVDKISIDAGAIQATIANPIYKDHKISLVSVAGPSRSGKSFLTSFLTEGAPGGQIRGEFKTGHRRVTEGIRIYQKPLIIEDDDDRKHAVFFLDTQGTFDLETEPAISEWITTFSLLVSDFQIINLKERIGGNDLRNIHRANEIAKAMPSMRLPEKLIFLIRDSVDAKTNGHALLDSFCNPRTQRELSDALNDLIESYPNAGIQCYQTSRPTSYIARASESVFLHGREDELLLRSLQKFKESLCSHIRSRSTSSIPKLEYWRQVANYLQNGVPPIRTSVEMTTQSLGQKWSNEALVYLGDVFKRADLKTIDELKKTALDRAERYIEDHLSSESIRNEAIDKAAAQIEARYQERKEQLERERNELARKEMTQQIVDEGRLKIRKIFSLEDALKFRQNNGFQEISAENQEARKELEEIFENKVTQLLPKHLANLLKRQNENYRGFLRMQANEEELSKARLMTTIENEIEKYQRALHELNQFISISEEMAAKFLSDARDDFTASFDKLFPIIQTIYDNKRSLAKSHQETGPLRDVNLLAGEEERKNPVPTSDDTKDLTMNGVEQKKSTIINVDREKLEKDKKIELLSSENTKDSKIASGENENSTNISEKQGKSMLRYEDKADSTVKHEDKEKTLAMSEGARKSLIFSEDQENSTIISDEQERPVIIKENQEKSAIIREDRKTTSVIRDDTENAEIMSEDQKDSTSTNISESPLFPLQERYHKEQDLNQIDLPEELVPEVDEITEILENLQISKRERTGDKALQTSAQVSKITAVNEILLRPISTQLPYEAEPSTTARMDLIQEVKSTQLATSQKESRHDLFRLNHFISIADIGAECAKEIETLIQLYREDPARRRTDFRRAMILLKNKEIEEYKEKISIISDNYSRAYQEVTGEVLEEEEKREVIAGCNECNREIERAIQESIMNIRRHVLPMFRKHGKSSTSACIRQIMDFQTLCRSKSLKFGVEAGFVAKFANAVNWLYMAYFGFPNLMHHWQATDTELDRIYDLKPARKISKKKYQKIQHLCSEQILKMFEAYSNHRTLEWLVNASQRIRETFSTILSRKDHLKVLADHLNDGILQGWSEYILDTIFTIRPSVTYGLDVFDYVTAFLEIDKVDPKRETLKSELRVRKGYLRC